MTMHPMFQRLPELQDIARILELYLRDKQPDTRIVSHYDGFTTGDNAVEVKVQPRKRAVRIRVRGLLREFPNCPELCMSYYRQSYTFFAISRYRQLSDTLLMLDRAVYHATKGRSRLKAA